MIATINDVEEIADFYTEYLSPRPEDESAVYANIEAFLLKHIGRSVHASILRMQGEIVSIAMLSEHIRIPDKQDTGFNTYDGFLNVLYTRADYRGMHLATGCLNEILMLAHDKGYKCVYAEHIDKIDGMLKRMSFTKMEKTIALKEIRHE